MASIGSATSPGFAFKQQATNFMKHQHRSSSNHVAASCTRAMNLRATAPAMANWASLLHMGTLGPSNRPSRRYHVASAAIGAEQEPPKPRVSLRQLVNASSACCTTAIHGKVDHCCKMAHSVTPRYTQVFEFRHFNIRHELTAMKMGTDAMLLGSWVRPGPAKRMLDIGTGTGVLALMLAQRAQPDAMIHAIDIEAAAAQQAQGNAAACIWHHMLSVFHISVQDLCHQHQQVHPSSTSAAPADSSHNEHDHSQACASTSSSSQQAGMPARSSAAKSAGHVMDTANPQDHHVWPEHYDLIISNPPFFQRSFKAQQQQRAMARHADITLPFQDLANGVAQLLAPDGRFCCILPPAEAKSIVALMEGHQIQLRRLLRVKGKAGQEQDKRWAMEFTRLQGSGADEAATEEEELVCIEHRYVEQLGVSKDVYTEQYRRLTQEFHHPKYFQY